MTVHKVTVVGNFVHSTGAAIARLLAEGPGRHVVLHGHGWARHIAADLRGAAYLGGLTSTVEAASSWSETAGSSVVVVTDGAHGNREDGDARGEVLGTLLVYGRSIGPEIAGWSPGAVVIVASCPVEVVGWHLVHSTRFPPDRVLGVGGDLGGSIFAREIADMCEIDVRWVSNALVVGLNRDPIPLVSQARVAGTPLQEAMTGDDITTVVRRTQLACNDMAQPLLAERSSFGWARATARMVDAILVNGDQSTDTVAHVFADGTFLGRPIRVGAGGMHALRDVAMSDAEAKRFDELVSEQQRRTPGM